MQLEREGVSKQFSKHIAPSMNDYKQDFQGYLIIKRESSILDFSDLGPLSIC